MYKNLSLFVLSSLVLGGLALASCTPTLYYQEEVVNRIVYPAWMVKREIPTDPFLLTAYERVHEFGGTARLYIEGDGFTRVSKKSASRNPTPHHPVALHMASKDKAENVIYLARPCQYSQLTDPDTPCTDKYWTTDSYGPEVINAYHQALDEIKARYKITNFDLVGYEGGGAIVGILAAQRDDIETLRTVAARMDKIPNPAALSRIPQRHFISENDDIIPESLLADYLNDMGSNNCVSYIKVSETNHEEGWANRWAGLLKEPVSCTGPAASDMPFINAVPAGNYITTRERPEKP